MDRSDLAPGLNTLAYRSLLADLGPFVGIGVLLMGIHFGLPTDIQAALAFSHREFEVWTLFTSAFVHNGTNHLLQNIVGFGGAVTVGYILSSALGAKHWFQRASVVFVVVLPVLVSLTSYGFISLAAPDATPTERGFSGVVAGFVGFIFAAFYVWLKEQTSRRVAHHGAQALVVVIAWELSLIYSGPDIPILGLVAIGLGLSGWGLSRQSHTLRQWWQRSETDILFTGAIVAILLTFIVLLFPKDITGGGQTVNIFAHAGGFIWGAVCALFLHFQSE